MVTSGKVGSAGDAKLAQVMTAPVVLPQQNAGHSAQCTTAWGREDLGGMLEGASTTKEAHSLTTGADLEPDGGGRSLPLDRASQPSVQQTCDGHQRVTRAARGVAEVVRGNTKGTRRALTGASRSQRANPAFNKLLPERDVITAYNWQAWQGC